MARKFFYVCAGILMLALSYHFGASTATAQAVGIDGPAIAWVDNSIDGPIRVSGVVNRIFYMLRNSGASVSIPEPIPGAARVIASDPTCSASSWRTATCTRAVADPDGPSWGTCTAVAPSPLCTSRGAA